MVKRMIIIGLTVLMAFNMLACGAVSTKKEGFEAFETVNTYGDNTFSDVKSGDWYEENVKRAYELGLFAGKENGRFDPQGEITIAEAITVADRLHKIYNTGDMSFEQSDPWYKCYFDYAEQNGIVEKGEFTAPNKSATRAQFAHIIANALPESAFEKINDIKIGDIPDVMGNEYFASAVYTLYNAGIIVGNDDYGTYKPNDTIERCAVSAIATRMADRSLRMEKTLKPFEKKAYITELKTDTFSIKVPMTDAMKDICTIEVSQNRIDFCGSDANMEVFDKSYAKNGIFAVAAWDEDQYRDWTEAGFPPIETIGKLQMNDGRVLVLVIVLTSDVPFDHNMAWEVWSGEQVSDIKDGISDIRAINGTFVPDEEATVLSDRKHNTWQEAYKDFLHNHLSDYLNGDGFTSLEKWYTVYDIDKDGTPELFIQCQTCMADATWCIYTYDAELKTVILIDCSIHNRGGEIIGSDGENAFYTPYYRSQWLGKYSLHNGKLEMSHGYSWDYSSVDNMVKLKVCPSYDMDSDEGLNWTGNNDSGNRHIADNLY